MEVDSKVEVGSQVEVVDSQVEADSPVEATLDTSLPTEVTNTRRFLAYSIRNTCSPHALAEPPLNCHY